MAFLHTQRSAVSSLRDRIAVLLEYLVDVETGTHACAQTSSLASRNNVALTPLSRARALARTRLLLPPPPSPAVFLYLTHFYSGPALQGS